MSSDAPEITERSPAAPRQNNATGLWLFGGVVAAVVLGIGAGFVPARLRLYFLFPVVHGLLLARLLWSWRRQLAESPVPRWAPWWGCVLVGVSVAIGAWQTSRIWQQAAGGRLQPGAALARQMIEQMPSGGDGVDPAVREELLKELNSSKDRRDFRRWLAARAGSAASPWPEILWGSECLVAMLTAFAWLRHAAFHAVPLSSGTTTP